MVKLLSSNLKDVTMMWIIYTHDGNKWECWIYSDTGCRVPPMTVVQTGPQKSRVLGSSFEWSSVCRVCQSMFSFNLAVEKSSNSPSMHKKFSHAQFSQLGSRKGCNDSHLFDPFECLWRIARHTAQALWLSLADAIHGSNEMNARGHADGSNAES